MKLGAISLYLQRLEPSTGGVEFLLAGVKQDGGGVIGLPILGRERERADT